MTIFSQALLRNNYSLTLCIIGIFFILSGSAFAAPTPPQPQKTVLRIGVPVSLENSGLMPLLAHAFTKDTGIEIQTRTVVEQDLFPVSRECSFDAIIANQPAAEFNFIRTGYGKKWIGILYADTLLIGPKENPAKVPADSLLSALQYIAENKIRFVSSRYSAGTKEVENTLWRLLKTPDVEGESWYKQVWPKPGNLLASAAAEKAYGLCESWDWYEHYNKSSTLEIIVSDHSIGANQYNLLTLDSAKCPNSQTALADTFATWLIGPGQKHIAAFRYNNAQLFFPLDATR